MSKEKKGSQKQSTFFSFVVKTAAVIVVWKIAKAVKEHCEHQMQA